MSIEHPTGRRSFLATMGVAGLATGLGPLHEAQAAFRAELGRLEADDDFNLARNLYSLAENITYFNHASIGTMPRAVQQARRVYLDLCETNPWLYMWGPAWAEQVEQTRAKVASFIGCDADELAITHNTTEGFNTLASGFPPGRGDGVRLHAHGPSIRKAGPGPP